MAPGPLPSPQKRRRNAPTIPSTDLPVSGRKGRPPAVPGSYELKKAGREWWKWAWATPQATAWDKGALYVVARRAQLEDDLVVLDEAAHFDVRELLLNYSPVEFDEKAERELGRHLEFMIGKLKAMASGRLGVMKEMRELDARLGLNPKAMADMRWTIVPDGTGLASNSPAPAAASKRPSNDRRARLTRVK